MLNESYINIKYYGLTLSLVNIWSNCFLSRLQLLFGDHMTEVHLLFYQSILPILLGATFYCYEIALVFIFYLFMKDLLHKLLSR